MGVYLILGVLVLSIIFLAVWQSTGFFPAVFSLIVVSSFFVLLYFAIINLAQKGADFVYY